LLGIQQQPETRPATSLSRDDAEVALISALKKAGFAGLGARCEGILIGDSSFRFSCKYQDPRFDSLWNCPYAGTPAPVVKHDSFNNWSSVDLGGCAEAGQKGRVSWTGSTNESADRFADALFVLANSPPPDVSQDAEFQRTVQQYRDAGGRLAVSEEVRAHRIGAEAAVKEKRFEDAVNEFGEALKLAPWWPQGHYNRALILAELGAYGAACRGMKRYLLLEPDAQNARQVQDKIYAWQAKVK
jgi:tetratricopeptide (TPR) repeat protein